MKDAKGHGSEKHGGGVAISGGKLITGINKPVRGSSTGVAISGGKLITGINKPGGGYRGTIVSDMTRSEFIAKHGTTAEKADASMSDKQAAAVLAQGNPKSAPVDVHPAMAPAPDFPRSMNRMESYADAGMKSGRARMGGDEAGARFHSDWARRATAMEKGDNVTRARNHFNDAYARATYRPVTPFK